MLSAVNTQRVDGRYVRSKMVAQPAIADAEGAFFRANAIRGSAMLRDAILRAAGAPWSGVDPRLNPANDGYHPTRRK